MAKTLTAKQAFEIASQWGSLMTSGDPGYVFYTFSGDKAVVQDEDHRAALIAYTKDCFDASYSKDFKDGGYSEDHAEEREELVALKAYFEAATLPAPPLDEFTEAYITAALWSTTGEDGEPLDDAYSAQDIAPETMAKIVADCTKFQEQTGGLLRYADVLYTGKGSDPIAIAGHDFWLTRNGHGAGFWDGDWKKAAGEVLTEASKAFGEFNLYVGDDGKIYSE